MTKDVIQLRRMAFLAGAMAVILGSFLPWACFGDLVWYCSAGIRFQIPQFSSADSEMAVMMVVIWVVGSLIISAIDSIWQWRSEIIIVFTISVLLCIPIGKAFVGGSIVLCYAPLRFGAFFVLLV